MHKNPRINLTSAWIKVKDFIENFDTTKGYRIQSQGNGIMLFCLSDSLPTLDCSATMVQKNEVIEYKASSDGDLYLRSIDGSEIVSIEEFKYE